MNGASDSSKSWFTVVNNEKKGPFTQEQISGLISAGVLTAHSKVWSEDLADWKPLYQTALRTLLPDAVIEPPDVSAASSERAADASHAQHAPGSAHASRPQRYTLYDNNLLGKVTRAFTFIYAIVAASQFLFLLRGGLSSEAKIYDRLRLLESEEVAIFEISLLALPTLILYFLWQYRTTSSLWASNGPQSVTPAGAVYWYFVPIAFFWKPYEAMRNLLAGYGVLEREHASLRAWWIAFWAMISVDVARGLFFPDPPLTATQMAYYGYNGMVATALAFAWLWYASRLIGEITRAAAERMRDAPHAASASMTSA